MAISIMKQNDRVATYVTEYVADTEADITNLPLSAAPGSACVVIESGNVYMLNNHKQWKPFGSSGGGSTGGGGGSSGGGNTGSSPNYSWGTFP